MKPTVLHTLDDRVLNYNMELSDKHACWSINQGILGDIFLINLISDTNLQTYAHIIEKIFDRINEATVESTSFSLFEGVTGFFHLLNTDLYDECFTDALDSFDFYLLKAISDDKNLDHRNFDLIGGSAGLLIYLGGRLNKSKEANACVTMIVDRFIGASNSIKETFCRIQGDGSLHGYRNYIDLGLSHGILGIIGALGHVASCDTEVRDRASSAINKYIKYMIEKTHRINGSLDIPYIVAENYLQREFSRSAWCYGSPGALIALKRDIYLQDFPYLREYCNELSDSVANRDEEFLQIDDYSLCHGTPGLFVILSWLNLKTKSIAKREYEYNLTTGLLDGDFVRFLDDPLCVFGSKFFKTTYLLQ